MARREIIALCMLGVIIFGCSTSTHDKADSDNTTSLYSGINDTPATQYIIDYTPSLGSLHTRKLIIRMERGGKFSILELDGIPIAKALSKKEFKKEFPQLYEKLETAIAEDKTENIILDASGH